MKESEERKSLTIRKKEGKLSSYQTYEKNDFIFDEDIIGFDSNVLIDLVESEEFKEEIKTFVSFNVLKICTTNIALGEARHVLIKKRKYSFDKATKSLKDIIKDFKIISIKHKSEYNPIAEELVKNLKQKMYIKKISTFPTDLRILINLIEQEKVNLYVTEDADIKKAVNLLNLPVRIKVVGEASQINQHKIKEFFKKNHKFRRKK